MAAKLCLQVGNKKQKAGETQCPTLYDPVDYTVHGILQARILEWVAFPFSRGSSQPRDQTQVSRIAGGFFTSWATREAQEYWSGEPIPSPGDLPDLGIKPGSPALQADRLPTKLQANHKNSASWEKSVSNYYLTTRLLKYGRDPYGPSLKYIWAEAT